MNNYQQEKQAYNERVKLLENIKILDRGPGKGTPVKVAAVYMLKYDDNFMGYHIKSCLAVGPFEANFDDRLVINGQLGDYEIYLLDKKLDSDQRIVIVQRDTTARIVKDLRVVLTFNYDCTPLNVQKLAAGLAKLVLDDNTTVDKALTALINPKKDDRKSDF